MHRLKYTSGVILEIYAASQCLNFLIHKMGEMILIS